MQQENSVSNFEQASRLKLRFGTAIGLIAVEDLWDLPLTSERGISLDSVARTVNADLKASETESFVEKATPFNEELRLGLDIVKHVISVKLLEYAQVAQARANREKKQKLLSLIAEKQDETLKASSVEDLQAMVEAL